MYIHVLQKNHQQIIAAYRSNSWVLMRQRYIEDVIQNKR